MGRRPDRERSRILLIGAGRFRSPQLPDIAAVEPGLEQLRKVLAGPDTGVFAGNRERCVVLRNPRTARDVFDSFFTLAGQADDVLLGRTDSSTGFPSRSGSSPHPPRVATARRRHRSPSLLRNVTVHDDMAELVGGIKFGAVAHVLIGP